MHICKFILRWPITISWFLNLCFPLYELKWAPVFWHRVTSLANWKKSLRFQYPQIEMRLGKRMVITTLPIMMIISSFNQKKHTHSHVNEKKNWDLFWARSETEMVGPGILDLYRASQICFHVNLSWFLFLF